MSVPFNSGIKLHKSPVTTEGCVVVIGNFDGLHLGHKALINEAARIARAEGRPLAVMTFEPHPREFFGHRSGDGKIESGEAFRLTLLPMKQRILSLWHVDHLYALDFNDALATMDAQRFIDEVLVKGLRAAHVVVGSDFTFGAKRGGNVDTLRAASAAGGFALSVASPVRDAQGEIYSSTRIREALAAAQFEEAERLLGWSWQIEAPVIHGDKRGRELGYPTANQDIGQFLRMPFGIYAVRVMVEGEDEWRCGAANFGIRPMFKLERPILETYIFDFNQDIYGKTLRIQPAKRLRPEMNFADIPGLQEQMKQDCLAAKAVLKSAQVL